jgi:hypothetical protein
MFFSVPYVQALNFFHAAFKARKSAGFLPHCATSVKLRLGVLLRRDTNNSNSEQ